MYLCRAMTNESFPKIGTEFGGKDHSTVMHSVEKIENEIKVNKDLANIIEKLKKDIGVVKNMWVLRCFSTGYVDTFLLKNKTIFEFSTFSTAII